MKYSYKNKEYEINLLVKSNTNNIDNNKPVTIYLHGWLRDLNDFKDVAVNNSILIDFLNFGASSKTDCFKLSDFTNQLRWVVKKFKIKSLNLVGHSFGGRVAIDYASKYEVNKLILISSAGIKSRNIWYYLKIIRYKVLKKLNKIVTIKSLYKYSSSDYLCLSDTMKKTYKNIVNKNLKRHLPKIDAQTLILNSINDKQIPYSFGLTMNKLIKNSKLIAFFNSTHFLFLEEKDKYKKIQNMFLKGE